MRMLKFSRNMNLSTLNNIHPTLFIRLACITLLSLFIGCQNPNEASKGFVKFDDGEPVQSGSVEFRSISDKARYASRIGPDGSFTLRDQDGKERCPPGEYEVVVVQIVLTEDLAAEKHDHGRTVPRKYADYYTSGLKVNKREEENTPLEVTLE